MLRKSQIAALVGLSAALWVIATLYIRLMPNALLDPIRGSVAFLMTLPVAWLSVWLTKAVGRLSAGQFLPGVILVGAVAMMIDGVALRWFPGIYGSDEKVTRLGSAWLLWGYGVSLAIGLFMAGAQQRTAAYAEACDRAPSKAGGAGANPNLRRRSRGAG